MCAGGFHGPLSLDVPRHRGQRRDKQRTVTFYQVAHSPIGPAGILRYVYNGTLVEAVECWSTGLYLRRASLSSIPPIATKRQRINTVSLPFYRSSLTTARPIPGYPDTLEHVGHHLLKRRLDLGLQQKEAAIILGTEAWNLRNWESGRHGIQNWYYPRIIEFLGYNPLPAATTRGQTVRRERLARGWSRRRLGREAGADEATVRRIEADTPASARKPLQRVLRTLNLERATR